MSSTFNFQPSTLNRFCAFTLIEVMVVVTLLSLIILALMTVFSSTQSAFRASVTQTDVLESGRAAMEMISDDLRALTPSFGVSNVVDQITKKSYQGPINFYAGTNFFQNPPLIQPLVASTNSRVNVQQDVFILSRNNLNGVPVWTGTGYAVWLSPNNTYSLYRFSTNRPVAQFQSASNLFFGDFFYFRQNATNGSYSHLLDGVVDFQIRAYDAYGRQILTNWPNIRTNAAPPSITFYSNALPASVEIELATMEDRALARAESLPFPQARTNYLAQQAGKVHVFRQRVTVPNVDASVYQ